MRGLCYSSETPQLPTRRNKWAAIAATAIAAATAAAVAAVPVVATTQHLQCKQPSVQPAQQHSLLWAQRSGGVVLLGGRAGAQGGATNSNECEEVRG